MSTAGIGTGTVPSTPRCSKVDEKSDIASSRLVCSGCCDGDRQLDVARPAISCSHLLFAATLDLTVQSRKASQIDPDL